MPGRLRRLTVYETTSRFYIVGCDSSASRYNVLKIDRIDSRALVTGEPENDYSKSDILELLATISEGNSIVYRSSSGKSQRVHGGLIERVSNAFGLLGCVRFLEGYYLIIVTKAHVVATLGYHNIYKVAEVAMIPVCAVSNPSAEEQRYVKIFQSVDLSTDFYFSYTYDMSRTLQENALSADWSPSGNASRTLQSDSRFVWNSFLLEPMRGNAISERWYLEVVHGFVSQQLIDLPISRLSLTLIGRRSVRYAGTRFLKRGANLNGDVANDVETEQIVWEGAPGLDGGRYSAFVQRRGSVPLRWSQDPSARGVVGKPPIRIDIHEPHAQTAARHFRDLRNKYGSPIVVMNLVKRREKHRQENLLHEQFLKAINYLNVFLPRRDHICYLSFDVARCNKASNVEENVLTKLHELAMKTVQKQGWFQTFPVPLARDDWSDALPLYKPKEHEIRAGRRWLLQQGVCRTNCVDCLDRTNVAQFGIARAALGCQLFSMGLVDDPNLQLNSEICRVLEELVDEHGDTCALQYAGSQLVHSVKTYKKTAAFQERSRDVIQTLSRYYSNTWGDYDKQAAINLFLGVYRPQISSTVPLWDLPTDYYLHFPIHLKIKAPIDGKIFEFTPEKTVVREETQTGEYCAWMLPDAELEDDEWEIVEGVEPKEAGLVPAEAAVDVANRDDAYGVLRIDRDDDFRDYYRTFEMSCLEYKIKQAVVAEQKAISVSGVNQDRDAAGQFMKLWKTDPKPAVKPSKKSAKEKDSDEEEDEADEETRRKDGEVEAEPAFERLVGGVSRGGAELAVEAGGPRKERVGSVLWTGLSPSQRAYGVDSRDAPSDASMKMYADYVMKGMRFDKEDWHAHKPTVLSAMTLPDVQVSPQRCFYPADNVYQTAYPSVSKASVRVYTQSIGLTRPLSGNDEEMFSRYPQRV